MILDLVTKTEFEEEARNSLEYSLMENITYFKLCGHQRDYYNGYPKNEICIESHQEKRLFYDTRHKIFIFLDPNYKTNEDYLCHLIQYPGTENICHHESDSESISCAEIKCWSPDGEHKKELREKRGRHLTVKTRGSRRILFQIIWK